MIDSFLLGAALALAVYVAWQLCQGVANRLP